MQRHCQRQWNLGIKYLNGQFLACTWGWQNPAKILVDISEFVTSFKDSSWATWTRLWEQIGAGRELGDLLQLHPTPSFIHMRSWRTILSSETNWVELQQWFPRLVGSSGVALAYDWAAKLSVFQQFQWSRMGQAHCLQSSSDELSHIHPIHIWSLGCYTFVLLQVEVTMHGEIVWIWWANFSQCMKFIDVSW